jgi:hypothetical protein
MKDTFASHGKSYLSPIHKGITLCVAFSIAACGPQRQVRYTDHHDKEGGVTSFSTPADLRLAFLRNNTSSVYCAEPMPDVALGSDASGSGSLAASLSLSQAAVKNAALSQENEILRNDLQKAMEKYERETASKDSSSASRNTSTSINNSGSGSLNLEATARLAVTVAELGGRTQQVLLAREFLYRICEARANNFFTGGQAYVELQTNALRLIEAIYASARQSSDAERASAAAELMKQINTYNTQQQAHCDNRATACENIASKDEEKKKACAAARKQCVDDIKPVEAPALNGVGAASGSNLPMPRSDATKPSDAPAPGGGGAPGGSTLRTPQPTK